MIVRQKKIVEVEKDVVVDVTCDVCKKSTLDREGMNWEFSSLAASWGYCSRKDMTQQTCHLCEDCHDKVIEFIKSMGGEIQDDCIPYCHPPE